MSDPSEPSAAVSVSPLAPAAPDAVLASYVPVLVQQRMFEEGGGLQQARVDSLRGALLFADISGFTALTERLAARGPAGIELLVRRLNAYFGTLIDVIQDFGGDVLKFAGDALVVHFAESSEGGSGAARGAVLCAARCALAVQQAVAAERDSEEGLVLSLKVAVAQGKLACAFLGGVRGRWEMVVFGQPLLDAGAAAGVCEPGWVVLAQSAWLAIADQASAEPVRDGVQRLLLCKADPMVQPLTPPHLQGRAAQAAWSFVPYAIRARLNSGQGDWLAEMRKITVIFVTLPGHASNTSLEQTQELMTRLQQLIYRVEGSVNKISVDDKGLSLVAVLGMPPLSHEDDPRRGLLLALDMHDLMVQLRFTPLIGVTTGRAFCGVIGNARRREYTMIGDIVNLSARLMVASAGQVLCDQATRDGAAEHFVFEPMAPLRLKGKQAPVAVYRPARQTSRRAQASNRFVGRHAERQRLQQALQLLRDGQSAVCVLEGEPGIGKSRLLGEMAALAREQGVCTVLGEADSIERTTAYVAWRGVLADLLGIEAERAGLPLPAAALTTLDAVPGRLERAPLLNDILPLGLTDSESTRELEGEARAAALRGLMVELLGGQTPMLLQIDDAQWLDSASWALLLDVVRKVEPLLLMLASRPLTQQDAGVELRELLRRTQSSALRLDGFDLDDTAELIRARLDVAQVEPALVRFVAERTQGNAFFIEQLLLALRDTQLIRLADGQCQIRPGVDLATQANLPDTIEGAITQRIDHLDPTEQLSLKVASVVGRAFGAKLINAIFPIEHLRGQLQPHLEALEQRGLTQLDGSDADASYLFGQILTQQVAYNLMLYSQRQALHLAVADWYEQSFVDCAPFYALIAHHLLQAGAAPRAVPYLILAGDQALARFACAEAVGLFTEALRLLEAGPSASTTLEQQRHCQLQMGHAHFLLAHLDQGILALRRGLVATPAAVPPSRLGKIWGVLREVAVQMRRRRRDRYRTPTSDVAAQAMPAEVGQHSAISAYARAYRDLSTSHYTRSEILDLIYCGLRGLNYAELLGPCAELAEALASMSVIASAAGRKQAAADYANRALALLERVPDPARRANLLVALAVYRSICCQWDAAIGVYQEVTSLAESINNWRLLQIGLFGMARSAMRVGRLPLSQQLFERLELLGRTVDNGQATAWGLSGMLQSQRQADRQHWESRMAALRACLELEAGRGHISSTDRALCNGAIALALSRLGQADAAEQQAWLTGEQILSTDAVATHMLDPLMWSCDIHLTRWKALGDADGRRRQRLLKLSRVLLRFARKYAFAPPIAWRVRGELLCLSGRAGRGIKSLRAALAAADAQHMPCEAARCHHALAEYLPAALSERGEQRSAARALYQRLEMGVDLARLEALS